MCLFEVLFFDIKALLLNLTKCFNLFDTKTTPNVGYLTTSLIASFSACYKTRVQTDFG